MTSTLHIRTPLSESVPLSKLMGVPVYFKNESCQPSGSYKIRGLGHTAQLAKGRGAKQFISSSGGNAGMAIAYAGKVLGVPTTVVVPRSSPAFIRDRIEDFGARVIIHGDVWAEANEHAEQLVREASERGENALLIHPFAQPETWTGHATLIEEIAEQLPPGVKPGAVVLSVGGGGLLMGVAQGLLQRGWGDVPIIACETEGAAKLAKSMAKGELVQLSEITTIAKTLGARAVTPAALDVAKTRDVRSWVCTDAQAVSALVRFADAERILVEPSCAAALSALYEKSEHLRGVSNIVVILCGGNLVTLEQVRDWQREFGLV